MKLHEPIDIENLVNGYATKHPEGFVRIELEEIVKSFPTLNLRKFKSALFGITAPEVGGEIVVYRHDVVTALLRGLGHRSMKVGEFD